MLSSSAKRGRGRTVVDEALFIEVGAMGNPLASWLMNSSTRTVTAKTRCNEATRSVESTPSDTMGACINALLLTIDAAAVDEPELGGGGSAMPCGLVLPAASAQFELADLLPDVRPTALSY